MAGLTVGEAAGIGLLAGGFLVFLGVCALIYYILLIIAWWKLFTKAGEKGWKAIIPFYNFYVQCKLTWKPLFFWIILALGIVAGILSNMATPKGDAQLFFGLACFAAAIALAVFTILSEYRLAKAYGHGGGYTVGLIFLNFIFMLILGFGKSKYQGNVYLKEQKKKKK